MSNTPETDRLAEEFKRNTLPDDVKLDILFGFTRKLECAFEELEQERDEARKERDQLKQLLAADSENVDAYLGVCIDRDELQEKYDTLAVENMLEVNEICKQRDAAIKELKEAWLAMDEIEGTDRINEWQNRNAHFLNTDT